MYKYFIFQNFPRCRSLGVACSVLTTCIVCCHIFCCFDPRFERKHMMMSYWLERFDMLGRHRKLPQSSNRAFASFAALAFTSAVKLAIAESRGLKVRTAKSDATISACGVTFHRLTPGDAIAIFLPSQGPLAIRPGGQLDPVHLPLMVNSKISDKRFWSTLKYGWSTSGYLNTPTSRTVLLCVSCL